MWNAPRCGFTVQNFDIGYFESLVGVVGCKSKSRACVSTMAGILRPIAREVLVIRLWVDGSPMLRWRRLIRNFGAVGMPVRKVFFGSALNHQFGQIFMRNTSSQIRLRYSPDQQMNVWSLPTMPGGSGVRHVKICKRIQSEGSTKGTARDEQDYSIDARRVAATSVMMMREGRKVTHSCGGGDGDGDGVGAGGLGEPRGLRSGGVFALGSRKPACGDNA
jgi:hypothetical protein